MMSSLLWPDALRKLRAAWVPALAAALFAVAAPAHAVSNVVISQVYGGGGNSGATIKNDYIELYNRSAVDVNIGGWSVQYASATGTTWAVTPIPAGTVLPAGGYFLIKEALGAGGSVDITADATGTIAMASGAGKVALAPSTTALSGTKPATAIDLVGYGNTANGFEGSGPAPGLGNTTAAFRAGGGATDTDNNAADFGAGSPAPRYSGGDAIPGGGGGVSSCTGGTTVTPVAIYTIQGTGATSPLVGQIVTTSGVVTKVTNSGFFIQDLTGDGNPLTSDGIYVFASPASCTNAVLGNLVTVTGTVSEYVPGAGTASTPLTELTAVTSVTLVGTGYSITPTVVTLPLAAGDSFERFEGMLVTLQGSLTVEQNYFLAQYGQLTIGAGRHQTVTNAYRPNTPQALALADLQARSRLLLDDGSSVQNPNPTPYFNANGLGRAGDTVSNLTGVIDFGLATSTASGAGLYRLQPTSTPVFSFTNPRSGTPPVVGGNLRVAAMNVLNFFTTFTNGQTADGQTGQGCSLGGQVSAANCRGADNLTEFQRQRNKIVREMAGLNADVYGLMETQNNGNTAVQNLVDGLNAFIGSNSYVAIPVPAAGTGSDAIRVTMVYKPSRLTPLGLPLSDTNSINNRPTLAQSFVAANGEKFSFVVNHLKSKSSCPGSGADADQGDGQGCWNATRTAQAARLRTFVAQVQAAAGSNDVLLVGDFNAYAMEDPIYDLTSNGYIDQIGRYNTFGYSYVFDGTAGRLDHAISSASMSPRVNGAAEWHINADESPANDYNLEFKQPACATCAPDPYDGSGPYRASDHDPVLIGVNLYKTITGTSGRDTLVGTPGDDIIIGGAGADTLTGNGGNNVFVYQTVLDGGDTITDFQAGADLLDFRALLQSLSITSANPIASGHVVCTTSATGGVIGIDPDGAAGPAAARSMVLLKNVSCASALQAANFSFYDQAVGKAARAPAGPVTLTVR
jgi:predicted extracellular nuclease